ncbi:hypothetical protein ACH5RR_034138 [Cinchona calisaya]|uniref:Uncharacterized protein n=1 Tax=Cinchona calisaya TaxID=153742 RepID=A0ABD2YA10_9GENT
METNGDVDISPRVDIDRLSRVESMLSESRNESPHSSIPKDTSLENILEVNSLTTPSHTNDVDTSAGYVLPFRHDRDKPPNKYSLDFEKRRAKYPIVNYVSTRILSRYMCILYPCAMFPAEYKSL